MAQIAAEAAREAGAEVRLLRVAETAPEEVVEGQEGWKAQADKMADMILKNDAMALALTWVDEADYSFDGLNALVAGYADLDDSGEIDNEEEAEYYNSLLQATADALVSLGADPEEVATFIDDEDTAAGKKVGIQLSDTLDDEILEDADIQVKFAIRDDGLIKGSSAIFESYKKVVRNGKVVLKKKRLKRPKRMTAAQRAALKKARRKANRGAAKKKRAKSNRARKRRNL